MSNMSSDFIFTYSARSWQYFQFYFKITKTSHWTLSRNFVRLSCILMPYQQQTIRHLVDESDFGELYNVVVDATVFLGKPFWPDKIINYENFVRKIIRLSKYVPIFWMIHFFTKKTDSYLIFTRNKQQYFVVAVPDFCIYTFFCIVTRLLYRFSMQLDKILPYRLGLLCEKAPAVNFANISEKYMAMLGPTHSKVQYKLLESIRVKIFMHTMYT